MGIILNLSAFALRQLADAAGIKGAKGVIAFLQERFTAHQDLLIGALQRANDRAWYMLEFSLAGDSLWDRVKARFARAEDQAFRDQVRSFLDAGPLPGQAGPEFRNRCLRELRAARKDGLLSGKLDRDALLGQAGRFAPFGDPQSLLDAEWQVASVVADGLGEYRSLAEFLRMRPDQGSPLLVFAVRYYFRRAVEDDQKLFQGLTLTRLEGLAERQAGGFNALAALLDENHQQVMEALNEVLAATGEACAAAVAAGQEAASGRRVGEAVRDEQIRQSGKVDKLVAGMDELLRRNQAQGSVVRPGVSVSNEQELQVLKRFRDQFRASSEEDRKRLTSDQINIVAKADVLAGEYPSAVDHFEQAAQAASASTEKALAHYNAFQAALLGKDWDKGLRELMAAVKLDAKRFSPFPFKKFMPQKILGAGGFGVAFLCRDRDLDKDVVVKTLRAEGLELDATEVFREARVLDDLRHDVIVRLRGCGFDEASNNPYLVTDYFVGQSLEEYVAQKDPLKAEDLVEVARLMASGLQAAHTKEILHRDIKPANVLLRLEEGSWQVKLIDFGLAVRPSGLCNPATPAFTLQGGGLAGSIDYAAPEQMDPLQGVPVSPASDVYGFARTCCYALFRTHLPNRKDWEHLPEALAALIGECTSETPRERPQNFTAVLKRLDQIRRELEEAKAEKTRQDYKAAQPHFSRGMELLAQDSFAALVEFDQAISLAPLFSEAYLGWVRARGENVIFDDEGDFMELEGFYNDGVPEDVLAKINEAIQLNPRYAEAYAERAGLYVSGCDYDRAIKDADTAIQLNPQDVAAHIARAEAHRRKGNLVQAIADASVVIDLAPPHLPGRRHSEFFLNNVVEHIWTTNEMAWAYQIRAAAYEDKGNCSSAIADFTECIRLAPKYEKLYSRRAKLHLLIGDFDQSISDATYAGSSGLGTRAKAYLQKGDWDKAIADADKVIESLSRKEYADAYLIRAEAYWRKGDWNQAIANADEALIRDPKHSETCLVIRAEAYVGKKEYVRAIADATLAIHLCPKNAHAFAVRALGWMRLDDNDRGIADATEAIRLKPGEARSWRNRASAYFMKKEWDRALEDAGEAIRRNPKDVRGFIFQTKTYREKGDLDQAITVASETFRLNPSSDLELVLFRERALAYRLKGDYERAITDATEIVRLAPAKAVGYCSRGESYRLHGQFAAAIADFTKALEIDPDDPRTKELLEKAQRGESAPSAR